MYDSICMGIPPCDAPSIRQTPLYIRYRYRFVIEALKESRLKVAKDSKAMAVVDVASL